MGLTEIKENGDINLLVSTAISIDESGKVYRVKIRNDLFWHDGKKFTAGDVNYNFKGAEKKVIDEDTLEFNLSEPFSPFPTLLSQPLFKKGLVGLGPYKLNRVNFDDEKIVSLELMPKSSKDTFTKDINLPESLKSHINPNTKLIFKFYPTNDMLSQAMKLGEISAALGVKNSSAFKAPWYEVTEGADYSHVVAIFFNTKDAFLKEKTFRQALIYAIPQEAYQEGEHALGPIAPISWVYNSKLKVYDPSLTTAKETLEKTQTASESAKTRIILTAFPQNVKIAKKIAENWKTLGITIDVAIQASIPQIFQAFLFAQEIPSDPDQYTLWHSTQPGNITGYISARNDKLLEDGRKILDPEKRKQKYLDFQKYLVEDAPAAFLYYPTIYTIIRK
jgi:peptide/nickel transport system substrate-binding protein